MNDADKKPQGAAAKARPRLSPYCANLRSKKLFVTGAMPLVDSDVLDASNHCWCFVTQQVIGPDRSAVIPGKCSAGRDCFKSRYDELS